MARSFLPVTAGIIIGAGAAQQLIPRIGVRRVVLPGLSLAAAGLALLAATAEVDVPAGRRRDVERIESAEAVPVPA